MVLSLAVLVVLKATEAALEAVFKFIDNDREEMLHILRDGAASEITKI